MATIEEKQIAKEILLKMIDRGELNLRQPNSDKMAEDNLNEIITAYNKILPAISNKD